MPCSTVVWKRQIGAYKSLENAKKEWKQGYTIYDWNGKAVYPVQTSEKAVVLTGKFETQLPIIRKGNSGVAVSVLQSVLGVTVDAISETIQKHLCKFSRNQYRRFHLPLRLCFSGKLSVMLLYRLRNGHPQ